MDTRNNGRHLEPSLTNKQEAEDGGGRDGTEKGVGMNDDDLRTLDTLTNEDMKVLGCLLENISGSPFGLAQPHGFLTVLSGTHWPFFVMASFNIYLSLLLACSSALFSLS